MSARLVRLTLIATLAFAAVGQAQTAPPQRTFVDFGVLADRDSGYRGDGTWSPGLKLGVGGSVSTRLDVLFEADIPRKHQSEETRMLDVVDSTLGKVALRQVFTQREFHTNTFTGAAAWRFASRRIAAKLLVGGGFAFASYEISNTRTEPPYSVGRFATTEAIPISTLGVDAELSVTRPLAVVVEGRLHSSQVPGYPFEFNFPRAAAVVRWRF